MPKKDAPGISLEKAVARIQQMMDPASVVTHNDWIVNRLGTRRQFDVVIRGKSAGRDILGVIECRDRTRKTDAGHVDAFVKKARDVNANMVLMVSKKGFTRHALTNAKFEGVGTLSLLPNDPEDAGFSIGVRWYAALYKWVAKRFTILWPDDQPREMTFSAENVKWQDRPVIEWFLKELCTKYVTDTELGTHNIQLDFSEPRILTIEGQPHLVKGLLLTAERVCEKKSRWVRLMGDAFYDWQDKRMSIPAKGQIVTEGWRSDFSDWQPYEGEIPTPSQFMEGVMTAFLLHFDPQRDVVDLSVL